MKYLGLLRFRDQDFDYQNDSLDDVINYLEGYVADNPGAVLVGVINTVTLNVEFVGESFIGNEAYVEIELTDRVDNLK